MMHMVFRGESDEDVYIGKRDGHLSSSDKVGGNLRIFGVHRRLDFRWSERSPASGTKRDKSTFGYATAANLRPPARQFRQGLTDRDPLGIRQCLS